jgi:2-hydroxychromene-2-carboxylate isomerase
VPLTFQFWHDFASTYSYISAFRIEGLASEAGAEIEWKPFLLGPVFKGQGWDTSPFNIYPSKGRYMWRDIERLCDKYSIPFNKPSLFPRNSVSASRVALFGEHHAWCKEFSKSVYRFNFVEDKDISDEGVISSILDSVGQNPGQIIAEATSKENKGKLRRQTEEALGRGIFGAPTFLVGDELFWGNDRLEDALDWFKRCRERA